MKNWLSLVCLMVILGSVSAQDISRDTTYTVSRTLDKIRKYHPNANASAVLSDPSENIFVDKEVIYRSIGNRQLPANCFYPKSEKETEYPGVLLIHGGGWRAGNKSLMTPIAERLAAEGYVVVAPEYRLSLEAQFPAAVHDLKHAINWMRANSTDYQLNTDQIAVMGCSAGGQLAALIGTTNGNSEFEPDGLTHSTEVQAIIDVDGVLAFKHPESEEGKVASEWLGGAYEEVPETWEEASALTYAGPDTPPVLFLGSSYPRFLAGRQDFIDKISKYDIYSKTRIFEDAPHSFWLFYPWFEPTIEEVLSFLELTFKTN